MTTHSAVAFDLPVIINASSTHVVTAVPLKPTARILVIDPTLASPFRKRPRRIHAKIVQLCIVTFGAKFRIRKPVFWKLLAAVSHVLSPKHTELEHLLWS